MRSIDDSLRDAVSRSIERGIVRVARGSMPGAVYKGVQGPGHRTIFGEVHRAVDWEIARWISTRSLPP
jgi:hypothetical protein